MTSISIETSFMMVYDIINTFMNSIDYVAREYYLIRG